MSYKHQIEQELLRQNWEITEISSSTEWWIDESWKIRFKHNSNICLYVCFLVDPMFEGHRKQGQGISEIRATHTFPANRNDKVNTIASLQMLKGKFDLKLNAFISHLENYKCA